MPGSSIVEVKKRLVALLAARPGLADVQVEYAWPGGTTSREVIFLGAARGPMEIAGLRAGRKSRNETPRLEVIIRVELPGGTQQEADERALLLGVEVEELLADDPTLGGTVAGLKFVVISDVELAYAYTDSSRISELTYTVDIDARLT